uniref:hypothetical protein n=1 Tax=Pedobacter schmidteae TaxID=2201271 RepID=UPI000EB248DB|nr:hypothetical protein [Pedobacter schmidteae]
MIKPLLTFVVIAIIAVGGAFANHEKAASIFEGSPYNDQGNCETPTPVMPGQTCDVTPSLIRCTLQIGGDAYIYNPETEACTKALYRQ